MKNYVFDTSVLIHDPNAYQNFPDSKIIIPIAVLNELDKLKKLPTGAGKNARVAIRLLDEIQQESNNLVVLKNNTSIHFATKYYDIVNNPMFAGLGDPSYGDTQILAHVIDLSLNEDLNQNNDIVLVSNDINMRVKAKARGITAIAYENEKYSLSDLYAGSQTVCREEAGLELQKNGHLNPADYELNLQPNECVLFEADNGDGIALGRKVSDNKIKLIKKIYPWNISSRNKEQAFAIDLIMDKNIDLVTLIGKAGTGKSLIVLAAALELVLNRREYDKLIIYRPIQAVGNDLGYLPGLLSEKLAPWFQAIMDNLELLFTTKNNDWRKELEMYQKKGKIEMEAITYIRGRSIPNSIILIDECQNLGKEEVKTILTRAGENTKIILTGDIEQIDNSSLDAVNNGLTYVIERFKESSIAGHITFTQGERSRLASMAAEIL